MSSFAPSLVRAHNFSPGPGALPTAVMQRAQAEFMNFANMGMGVIEITNLDSEGATHPGEARHPLQQMMLDTEHKLRTALDIPSSYRVLFMHGGAVGQFSAVPLNLLDDKRKADYVQMGFWTKRAAAEASKYCDVATPVTFDKRIQPVAEWKHAIRADASYVHICANETVQGMEYLEDPEWDDTMPPLVCDATSTLLSRPMDVARYGLIYSSGGKNLPAGLCVVIVRESLLAERQAHALCPQILDYRLNGGGLTPKSSVFESRPNTPPTFGVYMLGLILDDLLGAKRGLAAVQKWVASRAAKVYDAVEASGGFYSNNVEENSRSHMNVVFRIGGEGAGDLSVEKRFVAEATEAGLFALFGHPVEGGCRVTLYNGVEDASVDAVVAFMRAFLAHHRAPAGVAAA